MTDFPTPDTDPRIIDAMVALERGVIERHEFDSIRQSVIDELVERDVGPAHEQFAAQCIEAFLSACGMLHRYEHFLDELRSLGYPIEELRPIDVREVRRVVAWFQGR